MTSFEFYCCVGFFGLIMGMVVVAWVNMYGAMDQIVTPITQLIGCVAVKVPKF